MTMEVAFSLVLLSPFLGAVITCLLPSHLNVRVAQLTSLANLGGAICMAMAGRETGLWRHEISGWKAPLGIGIYIDGLAIVMILMTAVISTAVIAFGSSYFASNGQASDDKHRASGEGFWPLLLFLIASLNAIFLVADLFSLYVCLELITFAAVAAIALERDAQALKAAIRYLMAALLGSLAYLMGVALIYGQTGTLDWMLVANEQSSMMMTAISLIIVGLIIKSALFPLHFWLPTAHAIAPTPVSALLSALVVKASFYVLLRLLIQVVPETSGKFAVHLFGIFGAGAVLWGSFQAIIQQHIKVMVAYSTVAQIGYLFLVFPLLHAARELGEPEVMLDVWHGVIFFMVSHGVAKAALFLVAGIFIRLTACEEIQFLHGTAALAPIATLTWGLAGISLIGLPPSAGFLAKWLFLTSAIHTGQWFYAVIILVGGLLASIYIFRVLWYAFLSEVAEQAACRRATVVPFIMPVSALLLGVLIILLGIRTAEFHALLAIGSPFVKGEAP